MTAAAPTPRPAPVTPLPTLYLVRHGETDWNRDGRLQGHRDVPLNDAGRRQAVEAARRLTGLVAPDALPTLPFLSSPLGRARQTMELLRAALDLPPHAYVVETRLAELAFGRWEGLTWPEVIAADPAGAAARSRHLWSFAPPGGESYADLAARLEAWLATLTTDAVVVSHGGVTRALMVLAAGVPARDAGAFDVPQGRVCVLADGRVAWH